MFSLEKNVEDNLLLNKRCLVKLKYYLVFIISSSI
jgi:hypothetical protein